MSDKELEQKLRWIFETYGKDLQAFFRDAQKEFNRVKIMKDLELQNDGFTFPIRKVESALDICDCGDYRKDHPDNGPCNLNGLGHNIADYKCEKFHQAEERLTFKGVTIEFDNLRPVCEDDNVQ